MKKFWVDARPWNKDIVTTALESGAHGVVVPLGCDAKVKELGLITTISEDGDLKLGDDVLEIKIENKSDEEKVALLGAHKPVIVDTTDWTIIPLENLVAQSDHIIARVANADEAQTAITVLEKGTAGVLLATTDFNEIKKTATLMLQHSEPLALQEVEITGVKSLGMGDRVCVDTCTNMSPGQGMLVGNAGGAMLLVHAESLSNPYVAARPFRVNAGAVHAYIRVPGGKTRYLGELCAGDDVLIVNHDGQTMPAVVGRAKVEKRPLMLVEAQTLGEPARRLSLVLQNAETIRLTRPGGEAVSIVALKPGDRVLAYLGGEAHHFGMKIQESIQEK
jgi:3-dehydroquinate synthase II